MIRLPFIPSFARLASVSLLTLTVIFPTHAGTISYPHIVHPTLIHQAQSSGSNTNLINNPIPTAAHTTSYYGGHTTTFLFQNPQLGPVQLTLALLPDSTGWLFSEPGPGGRLTPRVRYIYRWWISKNGHLCYHYSPAPDRLTEHSLWSCWQTRVDSNGNPVLIHMNTGQPLPILARVPGNALESKSRSFMAVAIATYGPSLPSPKDPTPLPPP